MARTRRFAVVVLALCSWSFCASAQVLINASSVAAGSITPGDTPGYPATISIPGSYKLSGNLTGVGVTNIDITANYVTLDLGGFSVDSGTLCPAVNPVGNTCSPQANPNALIRISGMGVTIKNGIVHGNNKGHGIAYVGATAANLTLSDLVVSENVNNGMDIGSSGTGVNVNNVFASQNGGSGIATYVGANIRSSQFISNNSFGASVTAGQVTDSFAIQNALAGFAGQSQLNIEHSTTTLNGGDGAFANNSGLFSHVMANKNGKNGIETGDANVWGSLVVDSVANFIPNGYWGFLLGTNGCYSRIEAAKPYTQALSGGSHIIETNDPCLIGP